MQIGRDDLLLALLTAAVRGGEGGTAFLGIPWNVAVPARRKEKVFVKVFNLRKKLILLGGAGNGERPNGVCVSITVTVVLFPAAVAGRPNENAALAVASLGDAVDECFGGHLARPVDRLAVVVWAPRSAVDVDVLRSQPERSRLDSVRHVAVQHPHAAHLGIERDTHRAERVIGGGRHLAGAAGSVSVRIRHVIMGHRVGVVAVDVVAGFGVLKSKVDS